MPSVLQAGAWRYLGPSAESWLVAASWLVLVLLCALLVRVLWVLEVLLPWVASEVNHQGQARRLLRRLLTRSQEVVQASELSWRGIGHEGCVLPPALLLLPRRQARAALLAAVIQLPRALLRAPL